MIDSMARYGRGTCMLGMARLVGKLVKANKIDFSDDYDATAFMCWYEAQLKSVEESRIRQMIAENAKAKLTDEELKVLGVEK